MAAGGTALCTCPFPRQLILAGGEGDVVPTLRCFLITMLVSFDLVAYEAACIRTANPEPDITGTNLSELQRGHVCEGPATRKVRRRLCPFLNYLLRLAPALR